MIIGNFTYDQARDSYSGDIKTLTLFRKVHLRPAKANGEKGPQYRVIVESEAGASELGAAWKRKSDAGREFLSISLDDPAITKPLYAALMPSEDGATAILIWSRSEKRKG